MAEPLALLIGFALDQQVTVQKAFSGPAELKRRLGHLDAARIAAMDPGRPRRGLPRATGAPPLPRRDGRARSRRCARAIADDYGNDAARVWTEAATGKDLETRLLGLPGIGEMKAKSLIAILGKRFGVRPPGYDDVAPTYPTLGDVDSPGALAAYQAGKRAPRRRPGGQGREGLRSRRRLHRTERPGPARSRSSGRRGVR